MVIELSLQSAEGGARDPGVGRRGKVYVSLDIYLALFQFFSQHAHGILAPTTATAVNVVLGMILTPFEKSATSPFLCVKNSRKKNRNKKHKT